MRGTFDGCQQEGCPRASRTCGYCNTHYTMIRQKNAGEWGNGVRGNRWGRNPVPDEIIDEYLRRLSKFERPGAIARDLGVTLQTLRRHAAARRKPA